MITDPNPPKTRTTFYIQTAAIEIFDGICKREGESMSAKVEAFILKYNMDHCPGNPQQRLDVISTLGAPFKAETCQTCNGKPVMYGLRGKVWLGYCGVHWDERRFSVSQSAADRNRKKR